VLMCVFSVSVVYQLTQSESAKKHDETRVAVTGVVQLTDSSLQLFTHTVRISSVVTVVNSNIWYTLTAFSYPHITLPRR